MKLRVLYLICLAGFVAAGTAPARADERPAPTAPPNVEARPAAAAPLGLRLALQSDAAEGRATGDFRNQLLVLRLDLFFTPRASLGAALAAANLKGKQGRAGNLLPMVVVGYRSPLGSSGRWNVPLRFAMGYLPRNGPVARVSAGIAYALGARWEIGADLIAPMAWVTNDQMLLSMNFALEVSRRF